MIVRRGVSILLAILLGWCISFARKSSASEGASLRGLRAVYVKVHYAGRPHPKAGLTKSQLAAEVSLRLKIAGLRVVPRSEWEKTAGRPYVYLDVTDTALPSGEGNRLGYVYTCSLDLMQESSLVRSRESIVDACTWSQGATIVVPPNDLGQVRILIGNLASEFTAAVRGADQATRESIPSGMVEK